MTKPARKPKLSVALKANLKRRKVQRAVPAASKNAQTLAAAPTNRREAS